MFFFKENQNLKMEIEKLHQESRKENEKLETKNHTLLEQIQEMKAKEIL